MSNFRIINFLPGRLIIDQIRYNISMLGLWIFLLVAIFGGIGRVYGIHYLFLDPEYLYEVNIYSFLWVGLALGNFTIAFHITSYILLGHRYSFIGILEKPFTKFSINNGIIPLLFLLIYLTKIVWFHWSSPLISRWEIVEYLGGLLIGFLIMVSIVMAYLQWTNSDIFRYLAGSVDKRLRKSVLSRDRMMQRYREARVGTMPVTHYLDTRFKIRNCQNLHDFPDRASILKVFDQNHFNSVILEFLIIVLLLVLGMLVEYPWAQIPAAASVLLLFSMIMMAVGAISFWFRDWGVPIFILLFLLLNLLSRMGILSGNHAALGLDYSKPSAEYSHGQLSKISSQENVQSDKEYLIRTLENWDTHQADSVKSPLIMICASGGGQRAALWTLAVLQEADKRLNQELLDRTFSITGASGGMIGAAYYRELYLHKNNGRAVAMDSPQWVENIGKDNLNALVFSLISNDIFIDVKKVQDGDLTYYADRGTLFEHNLNRNLSYIFKRRLGDYTSYESSASIPMMIFAPVVGNDGRKLYVSSSPVGYMTIGVQSGAEGEAAKIRGLDFNRLFKQHRADSLKMLSALRMSASFPYITPTVRLPSDPPIEVMDAGISDNFGISDALHLSYVAKDWINEHASSLVLMVIRDTRKTTPIEPLSNPTLIHRFTYPVSSVYNNLSNMQDVKNDQAIEYARDWLTIPLEVVSLEYDAVSFADEEEGILLRQNRLNTQEVARASLSWHLTAREKQYIIADLSNPSNERSFERLVKLMRQ